MPNYYQIIDVTPAATQTEIEQALDVQYNKWRRLVTHHDPEIVNQANQALQALEKIRPVLTDPQKRSAYDAAIRSMVGGLEDPSVPQAPSGQMPVPPGRFSASPQAQSVPHHLPPTQLQAQNIWNCPKCNAQNIANTQFCKSCGQPLTITCPVCSKVVERGSMYCTNCGVNIPEAQRKKELEGKLAQLRSQLSITENDVPRPEADLGNMKKLIFYTGAWTIVSITAGLSYLFTVPGNFPGFDLTRVFAAGNGVSSATQTTTAAPVWVTIMLVILAIVIVFLSVVERVSPLRGLGSVLAVLLFLGFPQTALPLLGIPGGGSISNRIPIMLITAVVYLVPLLIVSSMPGRNFRTYKPFNKQLPNLSFLSSIYGLVLLAVPLMYGTYYSAIVYRLPTVGAFISNYEFYVWLVNAIQLFICGGLLCAYVLIGWNTTRGIETRYQQAVLQRTEKIENLNQQIKLTENAIEQIKLKP